MGNFAKAFAHHQAGDLQQARELCRQLLASDPSHADALHLCGVIALQMDDAEAAADLLERAVTHASGRCDYYTNLGEAYRRCGRLEAAARAFRHAIALDSEHAEAYGNLGVVLRQQDQVGESVNCFRKAVALDPQFIEATINLGTSLRELGQLTEASEVFERAVRLRPNLNATRVSYGVCLLELGETEHALVVLEEALERCPEDMMARLALADGYLQNGDLAAAADCLQQAVAYAPDDAYAHYLLADIYLMQERLVDAEQCIRRALTLVPESAEYLDLLGWILRDQGRLDESLASIELALKLSPGNVSATNNLAQTLRELGDTEGALAVLSSSLELDPNRADTHNYIGKCLIARGDSQDAVKHFREAITLNPRLVGAWENLARAHKFTEEDREEIAKLKKLAESDGLTDPMRTSVLFALGKIEDDCGHYELAFSHYGDANALRRKSVAFDPHAHGESIDQKIAKFDTALFAAKKGLGSDSEIPIFIVGMLRSGTTLVEQILSSHRQIHGAGELSAFPNVRVSGRPADSAGDGYADGIEALSRGNIDDLSAQYLLHLTRNGEGCLRATDKMPNNYLHLGLVALLFPRARVIHCRRHPFDNCLSLFFQHLGALNPYAADLYHSGRYYREYLRLMTHWKSVLPLSIHEVDYEQLVSAQETTTRAMIAYCGVEWDENCLNYYHNRRAVLTASDWQVHQPIYTGSVGRWKRYRRYLAPLERGLAGLPG